MTLIWPFKGQRKVKRDYSIWLATHDILYWCSIVTIALSRTETLFFCRWPWSGLSRLPKVRLIMPSYSRLMTSHLCSIVTKPLSRTETPFFSRWPWSDLAYFTTYLSFAITYKLHVLIQSCIYTIFTHTIYAYLFVSEFSPIYVFLCIRIFMYT